MMITATKSAALAHQRQQVQRAHQVASLANVRCSILDEGTLREMLRDLNLELSPDFFQQPKKDEVWNKLEGLLAFVFGEESVQLRTDQELKRFISESTGCDLTSAMEYLPNQGHILRNSISLTRMLRYCQRIGDACGLEVGIGDLIRPSGKRLQVLFSAALTFLEFREEQLGETMSGVDKLLGMESETERLKEEIAAEKEIRQTMISQLQAREAQAAQFREELRAAESELQTETMALHRQEEQNELLTREKSAVEGAYKAKLSKEKRLKEEIEDLQSQVVSSPKRLVDSLKSLKDNVEEEKEGMRLAGIEEAGLLGRTEALSKVQRRMQKAEELLHDLKKKIQTRLEASDITQSLEDQLQNVSSSLTALSSEVNSHQLEFKKQSDLLQNARTTLETVVKNGEDRLRGVRLEAEAIESSTTQEAIETREIETKIGKIESTIAALQSRYESLFQSLSKSSKDFTNSALVLADLVTKDVKAQCDRTVLIQRRTQVADREALLTIQSIATKQPEALSQQLRQTNSLLNTFQIKRNTSNKSSPTDEADFSDDFSHPSDAKLLAHTNIKNSIKSNRNRDKYIAVNLNNNINGRSNNSIHPSSRDEGNDVEDTAEVSNDGDHDRHSSSNPSDVGNDGFDGSNSGRNRIVNSKMFRGGKTAIPLMSQYHHTDKKASMSTLRSSSNYQAASELHNHHHRPNNVDDIHINDYEDGRKSQGRDRHRTNNENSIPTLLTSKRSDDNCEDEFDEVDVGDISKTTDKSGVSNINNTELQSHPNVSGVSQTAFQQPSRHPNIRSGGRNAIESKQIFKKEEDYDARNDDDIKCQNNISKHSLPPLSSSSNNDSSDLSHSDDSDDGLGPHYYDEEDRGHRRQIKSVSTTVAMRPLQSLSSGGVEYDTTIVGNRGKRSGGSDKSQQIMNQENQHHAESVVRSVKRCDESLIVGGEIKKDEIEQLGVMVPSRRNQPKVRMPRMM